MHVCMQVRRAAQTALDAAVIKLQNDFESDIAEMERRQEARFLAQLSVLAATKHRTAVEHHLAAALSQLPGRGSLATLLQATSPEFRTLSKALRAATDRSGAGGLHVLRGYTIFSASKLRLFRHRVQSQLLRPASAAATPSREVETAICSAAFPAPMANRTSRYAAATSCRKTLRTTSPASSSTPVRLKWRPDSVSSHGRYPWARNQPSCLSW